MGQEVMSVTPSTLMCMLSMNLSPRNSLSPMTNPNITTKLMILDSIVSTQPVALKFHLLNPCKLSHIVIIVMTQNVSAWVFNLKIYNQAKTASISVYAEKLIYLLM